MNNLGRNLPAFDDKPGDPKGKGAFLSYAGVLSKVYIEEEISREPKVFEILGRLRKDIDIITIAHYKDVFNRSKQDFKEQKETLQLILAKKRPPFLYQGSRMCDAFGHENFYYVTNAVNCLYDCEYCYLRGVFPSANLLLFINTEDIFRALEEKIAEIKTKKESETQTGTAARNKSDSLYVCNSYETDLAAIDGLTNFMSEWLDFASRQEKMTLEIRTRSSNTRPFEGLAPLDNVIVAFSLSPEEVISRHEKRAPSLAARLQAAKRLLTLGWRARLCIDPIIYSDNWQEEYLGLVRQIKSEIKLEETEGVSLGVFRISDACLKTMRTVDPQSVISAFPFERNKDEGIFKYPDIIEKEMLDLVRNALK